MAISESGSGQQSEPLDATFDYSALQSRLGALLRKQLFFVGGLAKSGTTWVQLLLDGHPQVSCSGELHLCNRLFPALKSTLEAHNALLLEKTRTLFAETAPEPPLFAAEELQFLFASAVLLLLAARASDETVLAVGEKTPENAQFLARLGQIFPTARFIHVVRDPRDAAVSAWFHVLRTIPEETRLHFASASDYFRYYVQQWVAQVRLGEEFGRRHPHRYVEVTYEALSAEPEPALAALLRFLGVDHGSDAVRRCLSAAVFERLSGGRGRGREDRASLFRKGIVGDWKNHFGAEDQRYAIEKAGPYMRRFGFI
ncbi:MAG TPA: sulfotransferase [Stellaceae bacterium]|nr:sulfotransferase [Stellaceae bacterium]